MKIVALTFVSLILLTIVSTFALSKYYARYESMEKNLETSLSYDASTANAIKHATAASDMFKLLRIAMGEDLAEKSVIQLGLLNEYIEQVEYPNDRDTAREVMKDLHNNYAGILAAKMADSDSFKIILAFADNRTLIVKNIYNPFFEGKEPKNDVVAFSYNWFGQHRTDIDKRIEKRVIRSQEFWMDKQFQLSSLNRKLAVVE